MALTQISDLIVPGIFAPYVMQVANDTNALVQAGFVVPSPALNDKLAGGGSVFSFPSFASVDEAGTAANASTDASASPATPEKISGESEQVVRIERNRHFSSADLAASLAGADPLAMLGSNLARAVNQWRTASLVNQLAGIVNETRMASSVNTVGVEVLANQTTDTKFSAGALIDTLEAWSDKALDAPTAIVMHPDMYRRLMKANLITSIPSSAQNLGFGTYLGFSCIVDAKVGKRAGTTDGTVYTVYLIKAGAIQMGTGMARVPVAVARDELAADGGGIETLSIRDQFAMHVVGTSFVASSNNPTDTVLATASSWAIRYPAKAVGVCALVCN